MSKVKVGGWMRWHVRETDVDGDVGYDELAKIIKSRYYADVQNGYAFELQGPRTCGLLFEEKDFEYADDAADLFKEGEVAVKAGQRYIIGKALTKEDFLKGKM